MMRAVGVLFLALALGGAAGAGEIVFTNGSRLAGELASEVLMVSTGSAVIEVVSEQVAMLTRDEIRLKDGRVIRGTLVGGHLKARTSYGELAIRLDELRAFRADGTATPEATGSAAPADISESARASGVARAAGGPAAEPDSRVPERRPVVGAPEPPRGPTTVVEGAKKVGRGVEEAAKGIGKTVTEGADRLHDGAKSFGVAIWDAMKSVGRAVRSAFTGP